MQRHQLVRGFKARRLAATLSREGLKYRDEAFQLRAGGESHWYFDAKKATAAGVTLRKVGRLAVVEVCRLGINKPNICAMGGGGYALMHAMVAADPNYYSMTWAYKGKEDDPDNGLHGQRVEGKTLLLVDDVLSTGSSLVDTVTMIRDEGGEVTDALVLVDRSEGVAQARLLEELDVSCNALFRLSEERGRILPVV
jgi:orotate phosphoribosyltransferase